MLACMETERTLRRRKEIASKIREARLRAGLSQEGLGRLLNPPVVGATISGWERAQASVDVPTLEELARVLDQPLHFFTGQVVPRRDTEAEAIGKEMLRIIRNRGYANIERRESYRPTQAGRLYPVRNPIAASQAENLDSQAQDEIFIPDELTRGCQEVIVFYVAGDCLRGEGVRKGDHLIIDGARKQPLNGDIVAAVVNGEETAKLYYKYPDRIELCPAAEGYKPIIVREGDELEIIGIFHSVMPTGKRGRR